MEMWNSVSCGLGFEAFPHCDKRRHGGSFLTFLPMPLLPFTHGRLLQVSSEKETKAINGATRVLITSCILFEFPKMLFRSSTFEKQTSPVSQMCSWILEWRMGVMRISHIKALRQYNFVSYRVAPGGFFFRSTFCSADLSDISQIYSKATV